MIKVVKSLQFVILLLIFCVSSFAQNKIAAVDTNAFYDEKSGITELVIVNKKLEVEFKPVQEEIESLNKRLEKIIIENQQHPSKNQSISEVAKKSEEQWLEAQNLSNELNSKVEKAKDKYEKRKAEIIEPINKRIAEKLEVFKKSKGYMIVFDKNKLDDETVIIEDEPIDITNEFIKFCNEEFEREKQKINE